MLALLIAHITITASCLWSGFLFYRSVSKENTQRPIIFYLISGLVLLAILAQILVLFFPIGSMTQLILATALLMSAAVKWHDCKNLFKTVLLEVSTWSTFSLILFLLSWITVLLINAGPTMMDDTESYHIQSIKWIQEYGSVPGLVNLHERFGFNSSWFSSVALFASFSQAESFTSLNGVISVWLCFWLISSFNLFNKKGNFQVSFGILVILVTGTVVWPLLRGNAATANYDFITTVIVLILFTEIFFYEKISPSIEWIIWPAYLFTVRMINFPLLALSLFAFIWFIKQKKSKATLLPIVYCLLLIVPFLIRNIVIDGFPFYPANYFDIANVDWKPDPMLTEKLLEYIKYYNRVSTTYLEIEQTKALGSNWVPAWFKYLFLFDKFMVIVGLAGILLTAVQLSIRKTNYHRSIITGLMIAWLCCWFLVAPDPRFVYGVLLFGIFLFAYHSISLIKNTRLIKVAMNVLLIALIAASSYYFISKLWKQEEYRNWIIPAQIPQPPVKEVLIDGMTFRIPAPINNNWNARCYGTDLPCLYKIDPRLKPRTRNLRSGFRLGK